jgi:hypothetical protein
MRALVLCERFFLLVVEHLGNEAASTVCWQVDDDGQGEEGQAEEGCEGTAKEGEESGETTRKGDLLVRVEVARQRGGTEGLGGKAGLVECVSVVEQDLAKALYVRVLRVREVVDEPAAD